MFGQPCEPQCDEQQVEHEELGTFSFHDQGQPPANEMPPSNQQNGNEGHGFDHGQ